MANEASRQQALYSLLEENRTKSLRHFVSRKDTHCQQRLLCNKAALAIVIRDAVLTLGQGHSNSRPLTYGNPSSVLHVIGAKDGCHFSWPICSIHSLCICVLFVCICRCICQHNGPNYLTGVTFELVYIHL